MNRNSIITLCNYASQDIYNLISIRNPNLDSIQKKLKIQSIFKELMNNIRILSKTNELDPYNTPMSFLFQHMKPSIIQLVANCSPKIEKLFIEKGLIYNIDWNIRFLNALINLGAKDIIIWFFLHIPYYNDDKNDYNLHLDKKRDTYMKILNYLMISAKLYYMLTIFCLMYFYFIVYAPEKEKGYIHANYKESLEILLSIGQIFSKKNESWLPFVKDEKSHDFDAIWVASLMYLIYDKYISSIDDDKQNDENNEKNNWRRKPWQR